MARIKSQEQETCSIIDSLEQQKNPPHKKNVLIRAASGAGFSLPGRILYMTFLITLLHTQDFFTSTHPNAWEWRCLALAFHCMFPLQFSDANQIAMGKVWDGMSMIFLWALCSQLIDQEKS